MMNLNKIISPLYVIVLMLFTNDVSGQKSEKKMKLKKVEYEIIVNVRPEKAWEVLADYGNVGLFHSGLISSKSLNGSENEAVLGCERECTIRNGRKNIVVKEKIIDIEEGSFYTYDVYEWKNFPIKKMVNTYGVKTNLKGETIIYQKTNYRLNPGFLSGIMKGKLRKGARESLIGYKHYMETGEKNVDFKLLKKKYKKF